MRFERVLVTGAGGLLGRYAVSELAGRCAVSGLDLQAPGSPMPFVQASVCDGEAVARACRGQDAIVHIAAVPNPWAGSEDQIMAVNVGGTWNVLRAAEEAGVRRVVLVSSTASLGFSFKPGEVRAPLHLPACDGHPRRPVHAYGLSKKLCEELGRGFADRGRLEIVVLRSTFIAYPELKPEIVARARNPANYRGPCAGGRQPAGGGELWHHVDPRDVARAFRLALEMPKLRYAAFFVSAATTLAPDPTLDRVRACLGYVPEVRKPGTYEANPHAPLYDLAAARDDLGFEAEYDCRSWV